MIAISVHRVILFNQLNAKIKETHSEAFKTYSHDCRHMQKIAFCNEKEN